MAEMPAHEEKWFESVLFPKYDWKVHGKVPFRVQQSNESFVLEARDLVGSGGAELEADTRHVAMVLRGLDWRSQHQL